MKLHATLLISAICALIYVFLSLRVILTRFRGEKLGPDAQADRQLHVRIRVHGNFIEYVPLALILLALAEYRGAAPALLFAIVGLLFVGRLAHAVGMLRGSSPVRAFGMIATHGALLVAASALLLGR